MSVIVQYKPYIGSDLKIEPTARVMKLIGVKSFDIISWTIHNKRKFSRV